MTDLAPVRWLRRHPTAAAALVYLVRSAVLYAPALRPGHILSASDYLWSAAPWEAQRPADVRGFASNYELVDSVVQFHLGGVVVYPVEALLRFLEEHSRNGALPDRTRSETKWPGGAGTPRAVAHRR